MNHIVVGRKKQEGLQEMSEETVIRQCAPTLAGIKTGSLFSCQCEDKNELKDQIRSFNQKYVSRGLCLIPLNYSGKRALIYLYRPAGLRRDLEDNLARQMLKEEGYPCAAPELCITTLIRKLKAENGFPHEIGLFLSYPPEDVKGFIDNHACGFKYSGMWKVYGDINKALDMFRRFKHCTEIYCRMWEAGAGMDQLAVAV